MSEPRTIVDGPFVLTIFDDLGHMVISHDGAITWEKMFELKNRHWGDDARAIEVFPASANLVNTGNHRHLWRLGANDFCPDMLGLVDGDDSIVARHARAWAAAQTGVSL